MADWHVGMQVVCIVQGIPSKMSGRAREAGCIFPVKGLVYTIREFGRFNKSLILLEEIINPIPRGDKYEPGYDRKNFRPVKKTSIDIFRSLLTPTGDDGAATPRSPARVLSLDHVPHERICQHAQRDETLSPGPSRATLAPAISIEGAKPSSHVPSVDTAANGVAEFSGEAPRG